ncbi:MAG: hypothetical protein MSQ05_04780 [Akkermansia sp.]|nr:hypothetical protein [Akkermansia sp.]
MELRYLGTWAEVATGLGTENLDWNDTDTAGRITSLTTFCAGTETISRYPSYGTDAYAYAYDNIGNRLTAQEAEEQTAYTANNLNQYTAIQEGAAEAFAPSYDADGNQTLVKTSTGIWSVTYNAANRPVVFANEATGTVVECSYDSSGRRATKKVTVNGTVTLHQRYIYRGYLQIACCDLTRTAHPCLWLITWDPTQPIATRPLAIQKDGTWYTYGWDLTKNVTEVFTTTGYIGTAYTYTPYGEVSASGNITQPIQWSSEYHDAELDLVYYNYRHYNPADGRWTGRDLSFSKHKYLSPAVLQRTDFLGLIEMSKPTYKEVDSLMTLKGKEKLLFGGVSIRVELEATKEERGKEYCVIVKIVKFWIHTEVLKRNSLQYDFDENKPSSIDQKFIWRLRRTRDAFEIMGEENFWILYNSPFKQVSYEGVKVHENEHARIMLSYSSKIKDLLGSKTIVQCYQDCASRDRIYKGVMDKKCRYPRGSELSKRVRDEVYALFPPEKTMEALATRAEYQYYINTLLKD